MPQIITNKHGLPDTFVNAARQDNHIVRGDISVTQLIGPPQERMLRRTNTTEVDAMDLVWAMLGTAMHTILELSEVSIVEYRKLLSAADVLFKNKEDKAANWILERAKQLYPDGDNDNILLEQTLTVDVLGMMTLSGTLDKFTIDTGALEDYKTCSTWASIYPESKKKWMAQQNIYAYMLRENGYEVNSSHITAIYKDWSAGKTFTNKDYPKHPVGIIPIKLLPHNQVRDYIEKRVRLHYEAQEDVNNIPPCTSKERWHKGDQFAVMQEGKKRAVRVLDTMESANNYLKTNGYKMTKPYIETRHGQNLKCEKYCSVSAICPQWNKLKEEIANQTKEI